MALLRNLFTVQAIPGKMNSSEMPTYRHSAQDRKNLGILFFLRKTPQDTVPWPAGRTPVSLIWPTPFLLRGPGIFSRPMWKWIYPQHRWPTQVYSRCIVERSPPRYLLNPTPIFPLAWVWNFSFTLPNWYNKSVVVSFSSPFVFFFFLISDAVVYWL